MSKKLFKEQQRFRDWSVFAILSIFAALVGWRMVEAMVANQISVLNLILLAGVLALLGVSIYYLLQLRLSVQVSENSISWKYSPWFSKKKKIKLDEIEACEIVNSPPLSDWSGWGVNFHHQKVHSFTGRKGVQLRTKDGEELFIGTRNLSRLEKALRQAFGREATKA